MLFGETNNAYFHLNGSFYVNIFFAFLLLTFKFLKTANIGNFEVQLH